MNLTDIPVESRTLDLVPDLEVGAHEPDGQMCVMEAAAWLAGEPWSDHPDCVHPVIAAYCRALNDRCPREVRAELRAILPLLMQPTKRGRDTSVRLAMLCADWAVRTIAPLALDATGLQKEAETLRALPRIVDKATALKGKNAATYAADAATNAATYAAVNAATNAATYAAARATYAAARAAYAAARAATYAADAAAAADAATYAADAAAAAATYAADAAAAIFQIAIEFVATLCQEAAL